MSFPTTDAEIIVRSLTDRAAFGVVFERHYDAIHGYLARRAGWDAAEDLTSEVFVTAFRRRASYDRAHTDARPWLYGIAHNLVRRHHRSGARRARAHLRLIGDAPVPPDDQARVEDELEAGELVALLPEALAALSPDDRETLLLHCWEGMSYEDVAVAFDIPVGTVRSRIHRARRKLRERMASSGESGSAGS